MKKNKSCHQFYRGAVKKLLILTKLCLLFICVFTFTLSASSFAQQERVSLDLKNASIKVLLDEIQKQTNWCFLYNPEQTKQNAAYKNPCHEFSPSPNSPFLPAAMIFNGTSLSLAGLYTLFYTYRISAFLSIQP